MHALQFKTGLGCCNWIQGLTVFAFFSLFKLFENNVDKEQTIEKFLAHCGSEDFLWGIVKLMSSENLRVSGNSAYVFGTIGETSDGIDRIVGLLVNKTHPEAIKILSYLVNLLKSSDYECLMNAAGTIGTIVSYFFVIVIKRNTIQLRV